MNGKNIDELSIAPKGEFGIKKSNLDNSKNMKDIQNKSHYVNITNKITKGRNIEGKKYLNQYYIEEKLGQGSFGKIHRIVNITTNENFAAKILKKAVLKKKRDIFKGPDGKIRKKDAYEDVIKEMNILKTLCHPNVIKLYEIIDDPNYDKLYLIMDYCEYGQLIDWDEETLEFYNTHLDPKTHFEENQLKKIFKDVVLGVQYLHSKGIIHGDLKPQNLLMDSKGIMKIVDFGCAIQLPTSSKDDFLTETQGTYHFMAPEACSKFLKGYSGKKADIWSLGLILYSFVYFKVPFYKDSLLELFRSIEKDKVEYPAYPIISKELKELLSRFIEKNPQKRITLEQRIIIRQY